MPISRTRSVPKQPIEATVRMLRFWNRFLLALVIGLACILVAYHFGKLSNLFIFVSGVGFLVWGIKSYQSIQRQYKSGRFVIVGRFGHRFISTKSKSPASFALVYYSHILIQIVLVFLLFPGCMWLTFKR